MGCTSSKRIEVAVDAYRPPPSSFAVFDVNSIEEPWVKADAAPAPDDEKPPHVPTPPPLLDKLNGAIDSAPRTWDEVSKALEDLKPKLTAAPVTPPPPPAEDQSSAMRKNFSFHTLEELEAKAKVKPKPTESKPGSVPAPAPALVPVAKSLKDNIFIQKDREEREKEGKGLGFVRRDPLGDFPAISPPGGEDAVVLYTTSLGGVRRTYEDCNRVRHLMETYQVVFDERDVALDGGFRGELKELVGEGAAVVPRLFVKGRYIGGVEEVVALNETGRLSRIFNWAKVERGAGRLGCRGCGGARFVPCLGCGGSCKIVVGAQRERCGECNENGLVHCPMCA